MLPLTRHASLAMLSRMKVLTKAEASRKFQKVADLAHRGQTVIVTHEGRPWCRIVPANGRPAKSADEFEARLARIFPKTLPARTMKEFIEGR